MTAMKSPAQIAQRRKDLEAELNSLDDQEQAWENMTREERLTELLHSIQCTESHGDHSGYCRYHSSGWGTNNNTRINWLHKVKRFLETLPEDWPDEQVIAVARVVPK